MVVLPDETGTAGMNRRFVFSFSNGLEGQKLATLTVMKLVLQLCCDSILAHCRI